MNSFLGAVTGEWIGALGNQRAGRRVLTWRRSRRGARRIEGGDLIISGQKLWITNGTRG